MELSGKVALLVGGGKGYGQAIASALANEGADVAVADVQQDAAEETAKLVLEQGRKSIAIKIDVGSADEIEAALNRVVNEFGKIDILVHNLSAAISAQYVETSEEDYDLIMDFNAKGAFFTCRAAAKRMVEKGSGRIITISSMYGKSGGLLLPAYAASKAAVIGLTECLAAELLDFGITANAICPGLVERRELELGAMLKGKSPGEIEVEGYSASPMRTFDEADAVAKLVVFLGSDKASFMTGQALNLADDEVSYQRSLTIVK